VRKLQWKWREEQGLQSLARKLLCPFRRLNSNAGEVEQHWTPP
jgi:hypothetical protein